MPQAWSCSFVTLIILTWLQPISTQRVWQGLTPPLVANATELAVVNSESAVDAVIFEVISTLSTVAYNNTCTTSTGSCGGVAPVWVPNTTVPASLNATQINAPTLVGNGTTCTLISGASQLWPETLLSSLAVIPLGYQFAVFPNRIVAAYPEAPNATWLCSGNMTEIVDTPELIAVNGTGYRAAICGPKDILILLDTTLLLSDASLANIGYAAIESLIMGFASPGDFIGIFPYTSFTDTTLTPQLVSVGDNVATNALLARLTQFLNNLVTVNMTGPQLGAAIESALAVQTSSQATGHSAECNTLIVILSRGGDVVDSVNPQAVVQGLTNVVVFPVILGDAMVSTSLLAELACFTGGTITTVASLADAAELGTAFLGYFATVQQQLSPWWSAPHLSDFGTGELVVTVLLALYNPTLQGVFGAEVPYTAVTLNETITEADLFRIFSMSTECSPLFATTLNAPVVSQLQIDGGLNCSMISPTVPAAPPLQQAEYPLLFVSCLIPASFLIIPFALQQRYTPRPSRLYKASIGIYALLWCVAIGFFWGGIWNDLVAVRNFYSVTATVTAQEIHSYSCCSVVDCTCTESSPDLPTCSSLLNTTESGGGLCNNGYRCCGMPSCSPCSCDVTSTYCDNCCVCPYSVAQDTCNVTCASCSDVITFVSYAADGATYNTSLHASCGPTSGGEDCQAAYRIGDTFDAYVLKKQPQWLDFYVGPKMSYVAPAACAVGLSIVAFTVAVFLAVKGTVVTPIEEPRRLPYLDAKETA